jgi:hypothetical protein
MSVGKAKGKSQKAKVIKVKSPEPFTFCPFAFCALPFAFPKAL